MLADGEYQFRAEYDGSVAWSEACAIPGCETASLTVSPAPPDRVVTITYSYDDLYRLEAADYSTGDSYAYAYDAVGNRLTQQSMVNGLSSAVAYAYDDANRLLGVSTGATVYDPLTAVAYTWDANGNLLADGVNTYAYDSANRLSTLNGAATTVGYTYNGMGDRLQEIANGSTTTFTMDLNTGLTQALSDGTYTYTYGLGRIAQYDTTAEYFLGDALGSVRQLTDTQGQITLAKAYNPYGELTQSAGAGQSSYGYTSEYQDSYNDLVYLRARHYAPSMGRFLSRDTWGGNFSQPITLNKWVYANANSIVYTDPSGFYAELALFKSGQEYGTIENATWSSDEMRLVNQALWNIAVAYARAYNSYALQFIEIDCLPQPVEAIYGIPLMWRITPYTAFLRIHGGRITFYKHDHKYREERVVLDKEGKPVIDKKTGQVKKETVELDNWGYGGSSNKISIYPGGEYSVSKFGRGDAPISEGNYIRFITHEMGHVFDHAIGDKGRAATTGALAAGGDNRNTNGFCGTYSTSTEGWQWRARGDDGYYEYFADMFVGWVYGCWEVDPNRLSGLSEKGELRSNFMNDNMPIWIYNKVNGR